MYKKSAIIICILVLVLSGITLPQVLRSRTQIPEYTVRASSVHAGNIVYYTDGRNDGAMIYALTSGGEIVNSWSDPSSGRVCALTALDDKIYALIYAGVKREDSHLFRRYRIRSFSAGLLPTGTSDIYQLHEGEQATDLNLQSGMFFISAVSDDGMRAETYPVSLDDALPEVSLEEAGTDSDKEEEEPEPVLLDSLYLKEAITGRFYVDAATRNGSLLVRTDQDAPEGEFAIDETAVMAVRNLHITTPRSMSMNRTFTAFWIAGTLILIAVIIMIFLAFYNRRRLVYTALVIEIIFTSMLFIFYPLFTDEQNKALVSARKEYASNALYALSGEIGDLDWQMDKSSEEGWYDSADYRQVQGRLSSFVSREGNNRIFYDVYVLSLKTGKILCSASGRNGQLASFVYGSHADEVWKELAEGGMESENVLTVAGDPYGIFGLTPNGLRSSNALIGIFNEAQPDIAAMGTRYDLLWKMLLIFAIGNALLFLVLWLQSRDLREFETAITDVALTGEHKKKGVVIGRDYTTMWNSLTEIEKRIEKINYNRYLIYESYYRYAPKDIERIFGKESISEVKGGDTIELMGTLAFVATGSGLPVPDKIGSLEKLLSFMDEHPEEEGILVSNNREMSVMELLFLEDRHSAQGFGIDLIRDDWMFTATGEEVEVHNAAENPYSLFLYYGPFTYGVAGTGKQSITFLLSPEANELVEISSWLRSLRLGLVVTKEVMEREGDSADYRYIGYYTLSATGHRIDLYEVLDACRKRERQAKIADREHFSRALDLFYQQDYYLARNRFSEILKRLPEDEVARWYLFECEHLLDDIRAMADDNTGALHIGMKK